MHTSTRKTAVMALLLNLSKAAVTDYANGLGGNAPCVESFVGVWESADVGYDPHATQGIQANDGSFVAAGGGLTTEGGTESQGFLIKTSNGACTYTSTYPNLTAKGTTCNKNWQWATKLGWSSMWVAESNDHTYFIAAGIKKTSTDGSVMNIAKVNGSDGAIVWQMNYGTGSGVETVAFTSDGGFVVGGYTGDSTPIKEMFFKSGGQLEAGAPFVGKVSKADAEGTASPRSFAWTWTTAETAYKGSAKALRIDSSDNVFVVAGTQSAVIKLDKDGTEVWKKVIDTGVQSSDLELASDGLVIVGHRGTSPGYLGHMKKLSPTGTVEWSKDFGNYGGGKNQFSGLTAGNPALIYNECWGIAPRKTNSVQDGYVIACGTGIEGCGGPNVQWEAECKADKRTTWRSLTIATDLKGEKVWHRMDSYQSGNAEVWSSANEYVFLSAGGKHTSITDEAMGFGFLTHKAYSGTICETADVVAPREEFSEDGDDGASSLKYSAALAAAVFATLF